jgi:hypothetical protein
MRAISAACLLALLQLLAGCGVSDGQPVPAGRLDAMSTAYTNRLPAADAESQAIALTQAVYPATREENGAGAIILVPQDAPTAFTAMSRVTHMPVNAPLLYLAPDGTLSDRTLHEMRRLAPDGVMQDGKTQVYAVGAVPQAAIGRIEQELGYEVRALRAADPFALAELADRWQAAMKSDHPDEVVVTALSREGMAHGLPAMGWNAHMGKGFAWVQRDSVPQATRRILSRRFGKAYIYLTGGPDVISDAVAIELARYGTVRRVAGADPPATSAVNAGYKDFGRNFGWWWSKEPRQFDWGIAKAGHNFVIGSAEDLLGMIPAAVLGHMGKHGPILLVERDGVPQQVADFLRAVRPFPTAPQETILNFAWIIGDESRVSWETQKALHRLLAPRPMEGTRG